MIASRTRTTPWAIQPIHTFNVWALLCVLACPLSSHAQSPDSIYSRSTFIRLEDVANEDDKGVTGEHAIEIADNSTLSAGYTGAWWKPLILTRQRQTPRQLGVTLNDILLRALVNSARIQVISDEPLIRETEITTADATFDWTAFLDARWDDISEPVGSTLATGGPLRLKDHNANVEFGLRRRNLFGGELEIGQRLGHQNNNSTFFVPNNQGSAQLTLNYTQPLLRGAGRVYNTSVTVLAQLKTDVSRRDFERQLQDHLMEVTQSYWNLYCERGKLLQQQRLLENGVAILEELESRAEVDALQSQIVRARAAVENRRALLVRARLSIRTAEARMRALVNDPALGGTMDVELVPQIHLSEAPFHVDLTDSIATAMRQRPEIDAAISTVKSASVRMKMSKQETLPLLNVILETYTLGLEGNSNIRRAYREQFTEGEPSYGVGLQYEYPIWNRAANSRLQKRRLELRRLQNQFRSTTEMVKLDVEISVHEVNAARESLDAKRRAMEAAFEEVDYLTDRWQLLPGENGSASLLLEDLLDAQDRLTDAELGLLQTHLDYATAQVNYKRAVGVLLSDNQISTERQCECELPTQRPVQLSPPVNSNWQETRYGIPVESTPGEPIHVQSLQTSYRPSPPQQPATRRHTLPERPAEPIARRVVPSPVASRPLFPQAAGDSLPLSQIR